MFGTGTVTLGRSEPGPVVPMTAIIQADHQTLVFIKIGERTYSRVDVTPGIREGNLVALVGSSLVPGQEVVIRGGHVLKSECLLRQGAAAL